MTSDTRYGEDIEELKELATTHFWPHSRQAADMSSSTGVKMVDKAEGVWVHDVEGSTWMDTLSGLWLINIGHGRKEIAEAVFNQMQQISFSPSGTVSPPTIKLAATLASMFTDKEARTYFVNGGSEAVETALKMAKNYHKNNGEPTRWKIISRRGSYHGATFACMSLGGGGISAPVNFGPLVPGNIHIEQPNGYTGRCCSANGGCTLDCARDLERAILHEGPSTVAAFIGEPISAASGIHLPHPDYWPTIREICDKYGVLMISDEVITGFGRTGKMYATEHWNAQPDIFTVAKALTSGYLPIGATVATKKIADIFIGEHDKTFGHLITFGGNPASSAAALANLAILQGEDMVANSETMGNYLFEQLETLYQHKIVGDVRGGKGLLCAIQLVKDRETKERFPKEAKLSDKVNTLMDQHGLLGRGGDIISLSPPLCITKDEVDYLVTQLDSIIQQVQTDL